MAWIANDPSKITEGLLCAGFMQLFFNSERKEWKVVKKRWISDGVVRLRWSLPLRRFTDWVAAMDELRLTFSFEACLDLFTRVTSKEKFHQQKRKRWKVFVSFEACLDLFTKASGKKSLTALKTPQLKNIVNCHYSINNWVTLFSACFLRKLVHQSLNVTHLQIISLTKHFLDYSHYGSELWNNEMNGIPTVCLTI